MMLKNHLRAYLFIFLSGLLISACAQLGLQSKKETAETAAPIPECKKNYTKEGNFISGRLYKTWVKYDNLDYKKGFDAVVMTVKTRGYRMIATDRESGTISTEMASGAQDQKTYPVDIKLVKEKTSLIVHLSSKSASGDSGQQCFCSFYQDFEKSAKRTLAASQPKQAPPPPKKPAEPEKESAPAAPPPVATSKPSPPPSTPPPPKASLPQVEVKWASVNLREGPGTNYKLVRTVKKGTSLAILEEKQDWLRVRLEDGKEAWVSKAATFKAAKTPPSTASPPASSPSATPDAPKPKSPM
jgi:hypothetical protein